MIVDNIYALAQLLLEKDHPCSHKSYWISKFGGRGGEEEWAGGLEGWIGISSQGRAC